MTLFFVCFSLIISISLSASNRKVLQECQANLINTNIDTISFAYADMLYQTGTCFFEKEFYNEASVYFERSLNITKLIENHALALKSAIKLGTAYFWMTEYEQALKHLELALNDASMVRTPKDSIVIYTTIGNIYYYMDKKHLSYLNTIKALEITPNQTDPQIMGDSYFVLAKMDVDQKKFEEGLEKINKAIALYESINNIRDLSYCYDVLAEIYHQTGKFDLALKYVKLSCEFESDDDYEQYYQAYCDHFYAEIYESMKDYDKALSYYQDALAIMEQSDQFGERIETQAEMGKLLATMGRCEESFKVLKSCLEEATKKQVKPIIRDVYHNLFKANQACGRNKKAVYYLQKYMLLKDSLLTEANLEEVALLGTVHELRQHKQEVAILQKDKKLQSAYNYLMVGAIFVLFTFIFLGGWTFQKQKQQHHLLQTKSTTISEQNEQLKKANEELQTANIELEQFAYIVSHDLKAPLRGISTLASFIEEDLEEDLTKESTLNIKENLQILKGRIIRMGNLIHGILAYSRVGRKDERREQVDLNLILKQLIQLLASTPNISIQITELLPIIITSKIAIQQVFQNLITNAIKYNDKSICEIEIYYQSKPTHYIFSVKDNGPGIPEKYHQKVFQIFQTLQPRDRMESTGVGLSIVKKSIEGLGGKVWIESKEGAGTIFFFTLPS